MSTWNLLCVCLLFRFVFGGGPVGPRAAIVASVDAESMSDVQGYLRSTNSFSLVDTFDTQTSVPSLTTLQNYDCVLLFSDLGEENSNLLGDTIADYIDAGGGVVSAVFDTASLPIGGRFNTDAYRVIIPLNQKEDIVLSLGTIHNPNHAVIQGITSVNGGTSSFTTTSANLTSGSTRIADWNDGTVLIAEKLNVGPMNARRIDLGVYPVSDRVFPDLFVSTSQVHLLVARSLLYVAGELTATTGIAETTGTTGPTQTTGAQTTGEQTSTTSPSTSSSTTSVTSTGSQTTGTTTGLTTGATTTTSTSTGSIISADTTGEQEQSAMESSSPDLAVIIPAVVVPVVVICTLVIAYVAWKKKKGHSTEDRAIEMKPKSGTTEKPKPKEEGSSSGSSGSSVEESSEGTESSSEGESSETESSEEGEKRSSKESN